MATNNNILRSYAIKIEADTKKAQEAIDQLESQLSEKSKGKAFAKNIEGQIESVNDTISGLQGSVSALSKDLKTLNDKVNFSEARNEFQKLNQTLGESVSAINEKINLLNDTINSFSENNFSGISDTITNGFKDAQAVLEGTLDKFKDLGTVMNSVLRGEIKPEDLSKQIDVMDAKATRSLNALKKNIKKNFEEIKEGLIDSFSLEDVKEGVLSSDLEMEELIRYSGLIESITKDIRSAKSISKDFSLSDITKMEGSVKLLEAYNNGLKKAIKTEESAIKTEKEVRFKYVLDDENNSALKSILDKIKKDVIEKVNKKIQHDKSYWIGIPVGYSSGIENADLKKQIDESTEEINNSKKLVNALNVSIKADVNNLIGDINEKVLEINKKLKTEGAKLEVDVVPKFGEQFVPDAKDELKYAFEEGAAKFEVNGGNISLDSSTGLATENTLNSIKLILESWNSSGIPGTQSEEFKCALQKRENDEFVAKGTDAYFNTRHSSKLSKEMESMYETTELMLADYDRLEAKWAALDKIIKSGAARKSTFDDFEKSDYYTRSFKKKDGIEYATFGDGFTTLEDWQKQLKDKFEYFQKLAETLEPKNLFKDFEGEQANFKKAIEQYKKNDSSFNENEWKNETQKAYEQWQKGLEKESRETLYSLFEVEKFKDYIANERKKVKHKKQKALRETLENNGVFFKKRSNGSYTTDIIAEKHTLTNKKDAYAKLTYEARSKANEGRQVVAILQQQEEALITQRKLMQDITLLQSKQVNGEELEEEELVRLNELRSKLSDSIKQFEDKDAEKKYESLIKEQEELVEKNRSGKGLNNDEMKRLISIPQEIESCFVQVKDLNSYIEKALAETEQNGLSNIDLMIQEKQDEIKKFVHQVNQEIKSIYNPFEEQKNDRDFYKEYNPLQSNDGRKHIFQAVNNQAQYDWNEKEIKRLKELNNQLEKLFSTVGASPENNYTGKRTFLGTDYEKNQYYRNQKRIKILETNNYLYDEANSVQKELNDSTSKLIEKQEIRIERLNDSNVEDTKRAGYETLLAEMSAAGVKNLGSRTSANYGDDVKKYFSSLGDEELEKALSSLTEFISESDKNSKLSNGQILVKVQEFMKQREQELSKELENAESYLEKMIASGKSNKAINYQKKRIEGIKKALSVYENNKNFNPKLNNASDDIGESINDIQKSYSDFMTEFDKVINEILGKYDLSSLDFDTIREKILGIRSRRNLESDLKSIGKNTINSKPIAFNDSDIRSLTSIVEKRLDLTKNIGYSNYDYQKAVSEYEDALSVRNKIIDTIKEESNLNDSNIKKYNKILAINELIEEKRQDVRKLLSSNDNTRNLYGLFGAELRNTINIKKNSLNDAKLNLKTAKQLGNQNDIQLYTERVNTFIDELEIVDEIINNFGKLTPTSLSKYKERYGEWIEKLESGFDLSYLFDSFGKDVEMKSKSQELITEIKQLIKRRNSFMDSFHDSLSSTGRDIFSRLGVIELDYRKDHFDELRRIADEWELNFENLSEGVNNYISEQVENISSANDIIDYLNKNYTDSRKPKELQKIVEPVQDELGKLGIKGQFGSLDELIKTIQDKIESINSAIELASGRIKDNKSANDFVARTFVDYIRNSKELFDLKNKKNLLNNLIDKSSIQKMDDTLLNSIFYNESIVIKKSFDELTDEAERIFNQADVGLDSKQVSNVVETVDKEIKNVESTLFEISKNVADSTGMGLKDVDDLLHQVLGSWVDPNIAATRKEIKGNSRLMDLSSAEGIFKNKEDQLIVAEANLLGKTIEEWRVIIEAAIKDASKKGIEFDRKEFVQSQIKQSSFADLYESLYSQYANPNMAYRDTAQSILNILEETNIEREKAAELETEEIRRSLELLNIRKREIETERKSQINSSKEKQRVNISEQYESSIKNIQSDIEKLNSEKKEYLKFDEEFNESINKEYNMSPKSYIDSIENIVELRKKENKILESTKSLQEKIKNFNPETYDSSPITYSFFDEKSREVVTQSISKLKAEDVIPSFQSHIDRNKEELQKITKALQESEKYIEGYENYIIDSTGDIAKVSDKKNKYNELQNQLKLFETYTDLELESSEEYKKLSSEFEKARKTLFLALTNYEYVSIDDLKKEASKITGIDSESYFDYLNSESEIEKKREQRNSILKKQRKENNADAEKTAVNNYKLKQLEDRALLSILQKEQFQLDYERQISEYEEKRKSVQDNLSNIQRLINDKEKELSLEEEKKENALKLVDIYTEISRFQKDNKMDAAQKSASYAIDSQLMLIKSLVEQAENTPKNSDEYRKLTEQIKESRLQLGIFRKEAESVGLTISEITGRAFLDDSFKSVQLSLLGNFNEMKNAVSDYEGIGTDAKKAEYKETLRLQNQEFIRESEIVKLLEDEYKERSLINKMYRIAGMNDLEAELSQKISKTNSQLLYRKNLTETQKEYLEQELNRLYKILEVENKLGNTNLTLNKKGFVNEKVSRSDFERSPQSFLTNKYIKQLFETGKYDSKSVQNYRPATESTLQNIQKILMSGVRVFIQKGYPNYKGKLNKLPGIDLDKTYNIGNQFYSYKKKHDPKKAFGYDKMNEQQKAIIQKLADAKNNGKSTKEIIADGIKLGLSKSKNGTLYLKDEKSKSASDKRKRKESAPKSYNSLNVGSKANQILKNIKDKSITDEIMKLAASTGAYGILETPSGDKFLKKWKNLTEEEKKVAEEFNAANDIKVDKSKWDEFEKKVVEVYDTIEFSSEKAAKSKAKMENPVSETETEPDTIESLTREIQEKQSELEKEKEQLANFIADAEALLDKYDLDKDEEFFKNLFSGVENGIENVEKFDELLDFAERNFKAYDELVEKYGKDSAYLDMFFQLDSEDDAGAYKYFGEDWENQSKNLNEWLEKLYENRKKISDDETPKKEASKWKLVADELDYVNASMEELNKWEKSARLPAKNKKADADTRKNYQEILDRVKEEKEKRKDDSSSTEKAEKKKQKSVDKTKKKAKESKKAQEEKPDSSPTEKSEKKKQKAIDETKKKAKKAKEEISQDFSSLSDDELKKLYNKSVGNAKRKNWKAETRQKYQNQADEIANILNSRGYKYENNKWVNEEINSYKSLIDVLNLYKRQLNELISFEKKAQKNPDLASSIPKMEENLALTKSTYDKLYQPLNDIFERNDPDELSVLENMFSEKQILQLRKEISTVESLENTLGNYTSIAQKSADQDKYSQNVIDAITQQNFSAAKSYETLSKNLNNYYELKLKVFSGDSLTIEEALFYEKVGAQIERAKNQLEEFEGIQAGSKLSQDLYNEFSKDFIGNNSKLLGSYLQNVINDLSSQLNNIYNNKNAANFTKDFTNRIEELQNTINKLSAFENLGETKSNLKGLSDIIKSITKEIQDMSVLARTSEAIPASVEEINKRMKEIEHTLHENSAMSTELKNKFKDLESEYKKLLSSNAPQSAVEELNAKLQELNYSMEKSGRTGKSMFDRMVTSLKTANAQLLSMYFSWMDWIRYIRQAVEVIREFDDALTEMRKVSDESIVSLKQYQKATFDVADSIGSTALYVQNSTADWLRLGESMEEAAESAKATTILKNVSEFESIDEATESLVAMSQAYKDLTKMDIIDVLNNIGNNYSISTDQLAQALQVSASALTTQANDIYESVALITAGNSVIQDAAKTGAGIRTISLRIAGTEKAKEELEDAGDDVADYIVRTASKTQKTIMDYTKTASNPLGVNVLDENGNLRSTYEILQDIADVYKEIQEEDKKYGTNRANALVEYLAGKNRANIAASILQAPEMLKSVYESAQDSAGSALEENEKYLDSITAKIQKFQNRLQELETDLVDSDLIKGVVDFGTRLISILDTVIDKFGTIPAILTTVLGGKAILHWKDIAESFSSFSKLANNVGTELTKISEIGNNADKIEKYVFSFKELDAETQSVILSSKLLSSADNELLKNQLLLASSREVSTVGLTQTATYQNIVSDAERKEIEVLLEKYQMDGMVNERIIQRIELENAEYGAIIRTMYAEKQQVDIINSNQMKIKGFGETIKSSMSAMVKSPGFWIGIITAVTTVVASQSRKIVQYQKDMASNAQEFGKELVDSEKQIKEYSDKIESLQKVLSSSSSSFKETKDARIELMEIQDQLISKYGSEADSIDLVNGRLSTQLETIEQLNEVDFYNKLAEMNSNKTPFGGKNISKIKNYTDLPLERLISGNRAYTGNSNENYKEYFDLSATEQMIYQYENMLKNVSFDKKDLDYAKEIASLYENVSIDEKKNQLIIVGTETEVEKTLEAINKSSLDNEEISGKFKTNISTAYSDMLNFSSSFSDIIKQIYKYQVIGNDSDLLNQMALIENAYSDYYEAMQNGEDSSKVSEEYFNALQTGIQMAEEKGENGVAQYIENLYPLFSKQFEKWKFNLDFNANTDEIQDNVKETLSGLTSDETIENILSWENSDNERQANIWTSLTASANEYGLKLEELLELLRMLGLVNSSDRKILVESLNKELGGDYSGFVRKLSDEQLSIFDEEDKFEDFVSYVQSGTTAIEALRKILKQVNTESTSTSKILSEVGESFNNFSSSVENVYDSLVSLQNPSESSKNKLESFFNIQDELNEMKRAITGDEDDVYEIDWDKIFNQRDDAFKKAQEKSGELLGIDVDAKVNVVPQDINTLVLETELQAKLDLINQEYNQKLEDINPNLRDFVDNLRDATINETELNYRLGLLSNYASAYQTLNEFIEDYNEKGYISIENLSNLLEGHPEYINYLTVENGKLALQTDLFKLQEIAQANEIAMKIRDIAVTKLHEMALSGDFSAMQDSTSATDDLAAGYELVGDAAIDAAIKEAIAAGMSEDAAMQMVSTYQAIIDGVFEGINNNYQGFNGIVSDSSSEAKDTIGDLMDYYDKALDAGWISFQEYTSAVTKALDDAYASGKISAAEYFQYVEQMLRKQIEIFERVIDAVTARLDREISIIQNKISDIELQNNALNKQKEEYDAVIQAIQDALDEEIDALEKEKEGIQDKIDALQDEQDAYDFLYKKEQALYELERAQSQRTKKVFTENGYVYQVDQKAVKDARKNLNDIKTEEIIRGLEDEIKAIDETIEKLQDMKEEWSKISEMFTKKKNAGIAAAMFGENWRQDLLDGKISLENFASSYVAIEEQIYNNDKLIESFNEQIEYYERIKDEWSEITSRYEEERNKLYAAQLLGADWEEKLLNGRLNVVEDFTNQYIKLNQMADEAAASNSLATAFESFGKGIEGAEGKLDEFMLKFNNMKTEWTGLAFNETGKNVVSKMLGENWESDLDNSVSKIQTSSEKTVVANEKSQKSYEDVSTSVKDTTTATDGMTESTSKATKAIEDEAVALGSVISLGTDFSTFEQTYSSVMNEFCDNTQLKESYDEKMEIYEELKLAWADLTTVFATEKDNQMEIEAQSEEYEVQMLNERQDNLELFNQNFKSLMQTQVNICLEAANKIADIMIALEASNWGAIKGIDGQLNTELFKAEDLISTAIALLEEYRGVIEEAISDIYSGGYGKAKAGTDTGGYKGGTKSAEPGYHLVAENGKEIILDNYGNAFIVPKQTMLPFEGGEMVLNNADTNKIISASKSVQPLSSVLSAQKIDGGLSSALSSFGKSKNNFGQLSSAGSTQNIKVDIGDIVLHNVQNVDTLSNEIVKKLPGKLMQKLKS